MRELHGVSTAADPDRLKNKGLLFDRLYLVNKEFVAPLAQLAPDKLATIEFLEQSQFLCSMSVHEFYNVVRTSASEMLDFEMATTFNMFFGDGRTAYKVSEDYWSRRLASALTDKNGINTVPIFSELQQTHAGPMENAMEQTVLSVAFQKLPVPDESCAWQDILDFKRESHVKLWGFRRLLDTLATKPQTEDEIRDEIEWSLNEYTEAMKLHHLKAGTSFVEVYVIPLQVQHYALRDPEEDLDRDHSISTSRNRSMSAFNRKPDHEPSARGGFSPYVSSPASERLPRQGQSESQPLRLTARNKGLEQAIPNVVGNSRTCVLHGDQHTFNGFFVDSAESEAATMTSRRSHTPTTAGSPWAPLIRSDTSSRIRTAAARMLPASRLTFADVNSG